MSEEKKTPPGGRESMATKLVELITESDAQLWHDPTTQQPYITVRIDDHREHYRLGTRSARDYLARLAHVHLGRAPGGQAVSDATTVLSGIACYDGEAHPVAVRIATHDGAIVLDLGDATWRAVVIRQDDWEIVAESPVRFRRPRGMRALPTPVRGGSLDDLRALLDIEQDEAWTQCVGWLVGTLAPRGQRWTLKFGQLAKVESSPRKRSLECHGRDGVIPLS